MHCVKCGTQVVASANYCHICGTKVNSVLAQVANPPSPVYEVCSTTFIMTKDRGPLGFSLNPFGGKATWQWIAEANGPHGKYDAAVSSQFKAPYRIEGNWRNGPEHHDAEARQALEQLVSTLLSDGWEPVVNDGYRPQFRRRIS